MSNYDVAIVMNQAALNGVLASLFAQQNLRSQLFSGSQQASVLGTKTTVSWSVLQTPTVTLSPPSAQQWSQAIKQDGSTPQPAQNALVVSFPALQVSETSTNPSTVPVEAIVVASINSKNALSLAPVAVIVDLSKASTFDQTLYKEIIIPQVLNLTTSMLSGEQIPNISFQGVQFGSLVLSVGNGLLAGVANLNGKPAPAAPDLTSLPNQNFYILLSHDAMQQIASTGSHQLQGQSTHTSGSKSFGIGSADYNAGIKLNNASASVSSSDLTRVNASVDVSASASAGINLFDSIGQTIVSIGQQIGNAFKSY
jgi:hypothetical protein